MSSRAPSVWMFEEQTLCADAFEAPTEATIKKAAAAASRRIENCGQARAHVTKPIRLIGLSTARRPIRSRAQPK